MLHGVHAGWWPKPLNRFFIDVSIVKSVLNPLGTIIFSLLWKGDMKGTFLKTKHTFYIRRFVNHLDNFSNFILSHPICNRHFSPLLWCGAATSNFNIPSLYQFSIVNAASIVDHSKDPGVEDGVVDNAPPPNPWARLWVVLTLHPLLPLQQKGHARSWRWHLDV